MKIVKSKHWEEWIQLFSASALYQMFPPSTSQGCGTQYKSTCILPGKWSSFFISVSGTLSVKTTWRPLEDAEAFWSLISVLPTDRFWASHVPFLDSVSPFVIWQDWARCPLISLSVQASLILTLLNTARLEKKNSVVAYFTSSLLWIILWLSKTILCLSPQECIESSSHLIHDSPHSKLHKHHVLSSK